MIDYDEYLAKLLQEEEDKDFFSKMSKQRQAEMVLAVIFAIVFVLFIGSGILSIVFDLMGWQ
jgi:cell division septal protein FtsQ